MLPKADVYVFTGDMLPNFPFVPVEDARSGRRTLWDPNGHLVTGGDKQRRPDGFPGHRVIEREREEEYQRRWIERRSHAALRATFAETARDAPVVCIRGNHDFVDLAPLFGGEVHELGADPSIVVEVAGLRWSGCRGINYIEGEWSDELDGPGWAARAALIPRDCDVLVTHAPPHGILDRSGVDRYGSHALASYVVGRAYAEHEGAPPLRAHLFGHIHEDNGRLSMGGATLFVNSATTFNMLEL